MSAEQPKKVPAEIESGIQNFDHGKLKHAETAEKNPLPSSDSQYRALRCLLSYVTQRLNHVVAGGWWSGVVVSALASINGVNQRRARLVLRWGDRVRVQFPVPDIYFGM